MSYIVAYIRVCHYMWFALFVLVALWGLLGLFHCGVCRLLGVSHYGFCHRLFGLVVGIVAHWVCPIMELLLIGFAVLCGLSPTVLRVCHSLIARYE